MKQSLSVIVMLVLTASLGCAQNAQVAAPRPTPRRTLFSPPDLNETAPEVFQAKFTTTKGEFVIEIHRDWAPLGADRFYNLVKNGFFENASFFRVLPGFIVQFGMHANPQVASVWYDANIKDDPVKHSNRSGTITFASAGRDTRTTQLFINLADNSSLDSRGFAPLGNIVKGMEVVKRLYGGYGEGAPEGSGPDQNLILRQGKTYLDKSFPKLDSIKSADIEAAGGTPAATH